MFFAKEDCSMSFTSFSATHPYTCVLPIDPDLQLRNEARGMSAWDLALRAALRQSSLKTYIDLPDPPPEAASSDRVYGYGWPLEDHFTVLEDISAKLSNNLIDRWTDGLSSLSHDSGYTLLLFPTPWQKDDKIGTWEDADGNIIEAKNKFMLAIAFNASWFWQCRRPTVQALKFLKHYLGENLQWLPDYYPKDGFRERYQFHQYI